MGDPAYPQAKTSTARVLPILTARRRVRIMRARGLCPRIPRYRLGAAFLPPAWDSLALDGQEPPPLDESSSSPSSPPPPVADLIAENERLRREVAELRRLLEGHSPPSAESASSDGGRCCSHCPGRYTLIRPRNDDDISYFPDSPPHDEAVAPRPLGEDLSATSACDLFSESLSQDVPVSQFRRQPYFYGTRFPSAHDAPARALDTSSREETPPPAASPVDLSPSTPPPGKRVRFGSPLERRRQFSKDSPPASVNRTRDESLSPSSSPPPSPSPSAIPWADSLAPSSLLPLYSRDL